MDINIFFTYSMTILQNMEGKKIKIKYINKMKV